MAKASRTHYRDVIHDTHSSMLEGASRIAESGDSIQLTENEFRVLRNRWDTLGARISAATEAIGFHWNGLEYNFVPKETNIWSSSGGALSVKLVFAPVTAPTKHAMVTYSLFRGAGGVPVLSFIGNPTSLLRGNNIGPVAVLDARNSHAENLALYRIGFQFVEHLLPSFRWSDLTRERIRSCNIRLSNTQWALGIPTSDIELDLAILSGLYSGRAVQERSSSALGEYLGFRTVTSYKDHRGTLTGLFLTKQRGRNHVLTVNWYDKRASVAAHHQTPTLRPAERELVATTIRLDITAHAEFLRQIIGEARRHLVDLITVRPRTAERWTRTFDTRRTVQRYAFLYRDSRGWRTTVDTEEITARRLCDAMWLLGFTAEARPRARGFASWLLQRVLERELRLFALLGTEPSNTLARFEPEAGRSGVHKRFCNRLLDYWTDYTGNLELQDFVESAASFLDVDPRSIRNAMVTIREQLGLDTSIPYVYWTDLGIVSGGYGLSARDRGLFYRAINDPTMPSAERLAVLERTRLARNERLSTNKRSLAASLQLMAQQIEAFPVRLGHLSKQDLVRTRRNA